MKNLTNQKTLLEISARILFLLKTSFFFVITFQTVSKRNPEISVYILKALGLVVIYIKKYFRYSRANIGSHLYVVTSFWF
jgi:uncharacterized membrane protein YobD (UPF0266 family)